MGTGQGTRHRGRTAVLLACLFVAAPAYSEDLAEVYAMSRNRDPKYRAARFDFEAAAYAEQQALAALLPNASFEVSNTKTNQKILSSQNAVFASGQSKYPTDNQTLNLTQPVFKLSAWLG